MRSDEIGETIEPELAECYEILTGRCSSGLVILCDHASNALPPDYGTLGLSQAELRRHIAWDIGAAAVTRRLSRLLGAPAVMTRFSRLLIDVNRGVDDPTLIMRLSDGAIIPGNRFLDQKEREARISRFYLPYHRAVRKVLDRVSASGRQPKLLGMHSFTEAWKGQMRPWHICVLWDEDQRMSEPLLAALRQEGDLVVGDNQPYPGQYEGDTMWQHGTQTGLPFSSLEMRQDLIADEAGQEAWAGRLARILTEVLASPMKSPAPPPI